MKIMHNKKSIKTIECKSFWMRFKGLMFKKNINHALLFNHCNSIHTFFMKENIDVIMCDKDNTILFYYPNLKRGKIILPKKNVSKVIETPKYYFNIKINDTLIIE